jgi:hypothetical protein
LTPRSAITHEYGRADKYSEGVSYDNFAFVVDGKNIAAVAESPEHLLEICDVVLRLLATSVVHSVQLNKHNSLDGDTLINALSLAYLMEQCKSLKVLELWNLEMDKNHLLLLLPLLLLEVSLQLPRLPLQALPFLLLLLLLILRLLLLRMLHLLLVRSAKHIL